MSPETAHHFTFGSLRLACTLPGMKWLLRHAYGYTDPQLEANVMGLHFPNRVGLAAGLDKNAEYLHELATLGFGFIEIGTVTPQPQPGNPKPRLFRLVSDKALINRMGFNNDGLQVVINRLKKRPKGLIIGGNIGKNKWTPNEEAITDYETCFLGLFPYVDYFVVNVSSPNTPGLRDLQEKEPLTALLKHLQELNRQQPATKPILLKIAPDLTDGQLNDIVAIVQDAGISGIIATNTTIARAPLTASTSTIEAIGAGGLSGAPLTTRSSEVIRYLRQQAPANVVLIGVGGIMTPANGRDRLADGADLIQVYSGLVYEGPRLIKGIKKLLARKDNR